MLKRIAALLFMLVLIAPMAARLLWGPPRDARDPKAVAEFPLPYGGGLLKVDYFRALDRYINNQIIFRAHLQRAKRWIDYRMFRRTERTDVHIGRQGWLYGRIDVENHIQRRCDDAGAVDQLLLDLHAIEKMAKTSGRRFLFLVVPSKASVYPEYIGWVPMTPEGRCNAYDLLREVHRDHPLEAWVPLKSAILANKFGSRLLYNASSRYWNGRGAAVAAEALYYSLFKVNTLAPVLGASDHRDNLERLVLADADTVPRDALRHLAGQSNQGLGRCLVYGDAGIERLLPHLARMAERLTVISAETVPSRRFDEDWRSFDSILIQTSESEIRDVHLNLDLIFDQLASEAAQATRAPVDLNAIRAIAHTALNTVAEGLAVKSVGRRSTFALNDLPGSYTGCFRVLRLNLSALQPDMMSVEYRTHPPVRVTRPIHAERFNLYLSLPVKSRVSLRFQPGNQAGLLLLHEAEIIGFPQGGPDACGRLQRNDPPLAAADRPAVQADTLIVTDSEHAATAKRVPAGNTPSLSNQTTPPHRAAHSSAPQLEGAGQPVRPVVAGADALNNPSRGPGVHPDRPGGDGARRPPDQPDSRAVAPDAKNVAELVTEKSAAGKASSAHETLDAVEGATIALNEFANGRIFQRQNHQADIIVSGGYTGAVAGVEARVVRHHGREEVVPWTLIDAAPHNDIFLGVLTGVPEGGWYALEIRAIGATSVVAQGRNRWGVGILIGCIGQSNMKEWFHSGDDLEAHPLLRKYAGNGWEEMGRQGNGAIACGNRIIARAGVPVGLIDHAVNGSGLHRRANWGTGYWEDTRSGSIYRRFVNAVDATGGRLEYVIWIQGEADAARGTVTGAAYKAALARFINRQVRLDIANGSGRPQLPFLVVGMVKRPGGRNEPHQALREAQHAVAEEVADCYLAATTLDLQNQGKQHLAPEAYTTMGRRVAQTILYILGLEHFYRGPRITAVRLENQQVLELTVQHRGGNDIAPNFGISGWEVVDHQGAVPILNVIRHDPRTIRIYLARPLSGQTELRYLYGARPDARRPLMDNASPSMPLEAFRLRLDASAVQPGNTPANAVR